MNAEYQSIVDDYNNASDAIDSKAGVILSAVIAISLASLAFIFAENLSQINAVILSTYALSLAIAGVFCMKVLQVKVHVTGGVIPKLRETNFSFSRQMVANSDGLPSDQERQLVKLDKLDSSVRLLQPIVKKKSDRIKLAQNIFAGSSATVFVIYFCILICSQV